MAFIRQLCVWYVGNTSVVSRLSVFLLLVSFCLLVVCPFPAEAGRFRRAGDGTVVDAKSGLIWEERSGGLMAWDRAVSYCENLVLAGGTDWILPAREHLEILIEGGVRMGRSTHWSSTIFANRPSHAWHIPYEDNGDVSTFSKDQFHNVRCVRLDSLKDRIAPSAPSALVATSVDGEQIDLSWEKGQDFRGVSEYLIFRNGTEVGRAYANCRFVDRAVDTGYSYCYQLRAVDAAGNMSDFSGEVCATVQSRPSLYIDPSTGLIVDSGRRMWQNRTDGDIYTWHEAAGQYHREHNPENHDVCGELLAGGYSDWRLPTREEVQSFLRSARQQSGKKVFPYLDIAGGSASVWTSTPSKSMAEGAFCIHIRSGDAFCNHVSQRKEVLCTRNRDPGGQFVGVKP